MRENLIGYLVRALDDEERDQVEAALQRDPGLQRELELFYESLEPLRACEEKYDLPVGLAERTCQFVLTRAVERQRVIAALPPDTTHVPGGWSFADMAVAAGIFLAAGMLLFPAMQHSRENARLAGCQNNLRQLGSALTEYSARNGGYFPSIPTRGPLSGAGVYAVRLREQGLLRDKSQVICPDSALAEQHAGVDVPTSAAIEAAQGELLAQLRNRMGGSYGYNLGYVEANKYRAVRNRQRPTFAMMADAPSADLEGYRSANHRKCGQNVLYEDGHVGFLTNCTAKGLEDHIFLNDEGHMAAGVHANDAVIGRSSSAPILRPASFGD